ncbi:unnamed protein product [Brassica oleracea]|uniref:(rape) hypothetical protein n=1 Tax=Brassica napus TaxID=3708 RepID=A0A816JG05_BRANA|nr:unnamed protein product [Brassica napus]
MDAGDLVVEHDSMDDLSRNRFRQTLHNRRSRGLVSSHFNPFSRISG